MLVEIIDVLEHSSVEYKNVVVVLVLPAYCREAFNKKRGWGRVIMYIARDIFF